jgi:hypothetical protein
VAGSRQYNQQVLTRQIANHGLHNAPKNWFLAFRKVESRGVLLRLIHPHSRRATRAFQLIGESVEFEPDTLILTLLDQLDWTDRC